MVNYVSHVHFLFLLMYVAELTLSFQHLTNYMLLRFLMMYLVRELVPISSILFSFSLYGFRYSILDLILRTIEALSVLDDYSQDICSNKEVFCLLSTLIRLLDKAEVHFSVPVTSISKTCTHLFVSLSNNYPFHSSKHWYNLDLLMMGIAQVANSCLTAAVLIANILIDSADLASEISQGKVAIFYLQWRWLFQVTGDKECLWVAPGSRPNYNKLFPIKKNIWPCSAVWFLGLKTSMSIRSDTLGPCRFDFPGGPARYIPFCIGWSRS